MIQRHKVRYFYITVNFTLLRVINIFIFFKTKALSNFIFVERCVRQSFWKCTRHPDSGQTFVVHTYACPMQESYQRHVTLSEFGVATYIGGLQGQSKLYTHKNNHSALSNKNQ